jgi:transcription-repair coupling factor (superfamily II helicase)
MVFRADWDLPENRVRGVRALVEQLSNIATKASKAAA